MLLGAHQDETGLFGKDNNAGKQKGAGKGKTKYERGWHHKEAPGRSGPALSGAVRTGHSGRHSVTGPPGVGAHSIAHHTHI